MATEANFKKAVIGCPTAIRLSPAIPVIGNTVRNMRVTYPIIPLNGNPVRRLCNTPVIPGAAAIPGIAGIAVTAPKADILPTYQY